MRSVGPICPRSVYGAIDGLPSQGLHIFLLLEYELIKCILKPQNKGKGKGLMYQLSHSDCSITHPSINYSVFYFLCWPVSLGRIISNWHGSVTYFRGKHHQESIIFFSGNTEKINIHLREKESLIFLHNLVMDSVLTKLLLINGKVRNILMIIITIFLKL